MAPLKPVKSLHDHCIDCLLKEIPQIKIHQDNFASLRKNLITVLPGTVRNCIVSTAVLKYCFCFPDILNIVSLFGDSTLKKLAITKKGDAINWFQCQQLFSVVDSYDIVGLHELDIKVSEVHFCRSDDCTQGEALRSLYSALSKGLASNLRTLVLHSAADNRTLKLIGSHAVHLTHLEVTCSWKVDDTGIADLLIKDSSRVINLPWPDLENRHPRAINRLSSLHHTQLNKTCETLCEVKIQDTNTSSISVILLLMFAKNLKSFGGFLYDRNIGDTVLSVQARENAPSSLALTELWDMDLPSDKLEKLLKFLPKLSHLYTRTVCLPEVPTVNFPLTHLTADFDFVHYGSQFFNFLDYYGISIRRLVLIDQVYGLNLGYIAAACPQLEELTAKVYVDETSVKATSQLQNLRFAEVRISSPHTFSWILEQADNIKHLEVLLEHENGIHDRFENDAITKLVEDNPKSLRSINYLGIHLLWKTIFEGLAFSCGKLHIEAAYALCTACNSLTVLGELETWIQVSEEDVLTMAEHIKKSNWDVRLRFRNTYYPVW